MPKLFRDTCIFIHSGWITIDHSSLHRIEIDLILVGVVGNTCLRLIAQTGSPDVWVIASAYCTERHSSFWELFLLVPGVAFTPPVLRNEPDKCIKAWAHSVDILEANVEDAT